VQGCKVNQHRQPKLTCTRILQWADVHRQETEQWPSSHSGRVRRIEGETWDRVDSALRRGARGPPGGSSLAQLLADRRGARNPAGAWRFQNNKLIKTELCSMKLSKARVVVTYCKQSDCDSASRHSGQVCSMFGGMDRLRKLGLAELTIPDKPQSKNQKMRITEKGRARLAEEWTSMTSL
jgi:hypothetical protein